MTGANDDVCAICLSAMDRTSVGDGLHTLKCGHTFHTACVVDALRLVGPACPVCRDAPRRPATGGRDDDAPPAQDPVDELLRSAAPSLSGADAVLAALFRFVAAQPAVAASYAGDGCCDGGLHAVLRPLLMLGLQQGLQALSENGSSVLRFHVQF